LTENSKALEQLYGDLQALKSKYGQNLSTECGLIIRNQVQVTSSSERARKIKLKYKHLARRLTPYGTLSANKLKQPGHPKGDYHYRNRVGRKASNWFKVW